MIVQSVSTLEYRDLNSPDGVLACDHVDVLLRPFSGYFATSEFGHRVAGPSTSMLTRGQRDEARQDPLSFRYSAGRGAKASQAEGIKWLEFAESESALAAMTEAVIVYRQSSVHGVALGLIADVSLTAYDQGRVKRHERTIPKTRHKMAKYMRRTRVYGNPVALANRGSESAQTMMVRLSGAEPTSKFTTVNGAAHELWVVGGSAAVDLCSLFEDDLYVTDGHHRLASASLVAEEEGRTDACIPAGLFGAGELALRSFARCISDPGLDVGRIEALLRSGHELVEVATPDARPLARHQVGLRLRDRFYRLTISPDSIPDDAYEALDANVLQNVILSPVFGIDNPRRDDRLEFVADLPVSAPLLAQADAWLLPYPASVEDVMNTADADLVMPAKSTWFAPKVPSGLAIRPLD